MIENVSLLQSHSRSKKLLSFFVPEQYQIGKTNHKFLVSADTASR
jgi:hypothetical protein